MHRVELTSVTSDEVVFHQGTEAIRFGDLEPDTEYMLEGQAVRTLPRPAGRELCRFATVNDVHFGETKCGILDGDESMGVCEVAPGEPPYPQTMNRGAVSELLAMDPAVVLVKGDLTSDGTEAQYREFLDCYAPLKDRLVVVRGNHDGYHGAEFAAIPVQEVALPGVHVVLLDTTVPRREYGRITRDQVDAVRGIASAHEGPMLLFGHHPLWSPDSAERPDSYFGVAPDDSEALVAAMVDHRNIRGYFAGHTHRNRVERFSECGDAVFVEVSSTKDFPGSWAEYRVFEGGFMQVHRRISSPEALAWSERTRSMFGGLYPQYSFGALADRCFTLGW